MFTNILVPVDGSEPAHKAVTVAGDLAGRYHARLTVIHVLRGAGSGLVPEELQPYLTAEHLRLTEHDIIQTAAREIVDREAEFLKRNGHADVDCCVEVGDPARTIVEYARTHGVDLIVIGSRGRGDLGGLLLGSTSHKVAHLAPCTCLTVR